MSMPSRSPTHVRNHESRIAERAAADDVAAACRHRRRTSAQEFLYPALLASSCARKKHGRDDE